MSRSARITATAIAVTTAASLVGAAVLTGVLGGNWLAVLAIGVALCVLSLAAFLLLAISGSAMVAASDAAEDLTPDLLPGYDDRDRWQS
jgi:hypothetical protein